MMQPRLFSLNISQPTTFQWKGKIISTGIYKVPVQDSVSVGFTNIEGDGQADLQHHGGVDKAVYAYPHEHYALWADELIRNDLTPGMFGENLTITALNESNMFIGDVLGIGSVVLQVSEPRLPCFKLGMRLNFPAIGRMLLKHRRTGFYLRVLQEGAMRSGDWIHIIKRDSEKISVHDIVDLHRKRKPDPQLLQRAIALVPLGVTWKRRFAATLEALPETQTLQPR